MKTLKPRLGLANTYAVSVPAKKGATLYDSPEWRDLVTQIIEERGRRCEDPACTKPHGPWARIYGDHIVEVNDGGAELDKSGVQLLCPPCHGRKTAKARAARAARRW